MKTKIVITSIELRGGYAVIGTEFEHELNKKQKCYAIRNLHKEVMARLFPRKFLLFTKKISPCNLIGSIIEVECDDDKTKTNSIY